MNSNLAPSVSFTPRRQDAKSDRQQFVEHLRFRGLSFQHTDCYVAPDMPLDQQGATERQPLIRAEGLRHTVFEDCEIAHAGENGLWLDAGCTDNTLRHCHLHDLGGSGLFVGPSHDPDRPEHAVLRNVIDNNWIHDGSHIFRGSQGVWIGRASHNQVTHNEISDFHHLGISVGHSWGYATSSANHNRIAFNHVHHICNGYFSDGGGIYTLGISPGTVIRNNVVHDVLPTPLMPVGGCGIYLDEGSSEILVENNLVYRVGAAAFTQHYGRDNVARNNVFAFAGRNPICCARAEEHRSYTFEGNIVLSDAGQATSDHFSPLRAKTEFRRNLYWDVSAKEPLFSGVSFEQWRATGRDRESQIADPQFLDPQQGNFQLRPGSPALGLGFQPIARDQAGLVGDAAWVAGPAQVRRPPLPDLPPPPPPPPPRPFAEDFESTAIGRQPAAFSCSPADVAGLIEVTEEQAASGRRSLKLTEGKDLKYGWQPHLFFNSRPYATGQVRFACDILNSAERPSVCGLSLRDYRPGAGEYREGPSLTFRTDGALLAAGRELARLPLGKWIHLELELDLDLPAPAADTPQTFRLVVTPAGQAAQTFPAVPYLHAAFGQVMWFGFSSFGDALAEYFVDHLQLEAMRR